MRSAVIQGVDPHNSIPFGINDHNPPLQTNFSLEKFFIYVMKILQNLNLKPPKHFFGAKTAYIALDNHISLFHEATARHVALVQIHAQGPSDADELDSLLAGVHPLHEIPEFNDINTLQSGKVKQVVSVPGLSGIRSLFLDHVREDDLVVLDVDVEPLLGAVVGGRVADPPLADLEVIVLVLLSAESDMVRVHSGLYADFWGPSNRGFAIFGEIHDYGSLGVELSCDVGPLGEGVGVRSSVAVPRVGCLLKVDLLDGAGIDIVDAEVVSCADDYVVSRHLPA